MSRTFAPIPHLSTFHFRALKLCLRTSVCVLPLAATQAPSHSSLTARSMEIMSPLYNGLCRPSSSIQLQPLSFVIQFRPCTSELLDPTFLGLSLPLPCAYLDHFIIMRRSTISSRDPCSCPACALDEIRGQFQELQEECRRIEGRSDTQHRELQQENHSIQENVVEMQQQMQRMEFRHNQELAIAMRGINRNTRQIEELNQRPANPQHPPRSAGTDESWIPSTSTRWPTTNQHVSIPPGFTDLAWDGEAQAQQHEDATQAEENRAPQRDEAGPSHSKSRFI
jgi:hypothetical protein